MRSPSSTQPPYRHKLTGEQLSGFFRSIRDEGVPLDSLAFLCIGTDRSTGDSLGPLLGTFLEEAGYAPIVGTLSRPCDGSNMEARLAELPQDRIVIAIDACLGKPVSVGYFQVANQPLEPGKSVGKRLPAVGHYSIAAIVNVDGPKKYWILQNTSLHQVVRMAKEIAGALMEVFPPAAPRS
ncbi:spore protease YyaC [Paenibacillus koleovorans]|uniref:spore protease YyaC n=1 Tax=Paenibacillus koleovorans TaxID=121608 RepID=UPI000FDAE5E2|nr:spore protease YyaC [Paenibacillus koleovorans]